MRRERWKHRGAQTNRRVVLYGVGITAVAVVLTAAYLLGGLLTGGDIEGRDIGIAIVLFPIVILFATMTWDVWRRRE